MTGVVGKVMGWKETSVTSLISVASPPNYRGKGSTEWVLTLVLQAAPTTLFFGKVVNSRTFGSMVGPGKKTCPRSTGASGQSKQAAPCQTQIVPGAPFFGCRRPLFRCDGLRTRSAFPTRLAWLSVTSLPSAKNGSVADLHTLLRALLQPNTP